MNLLCWMLCTCTEYICILLSLMCFPGNSLWGCSCIQTVWIWEKSVQTHAEPSGINLSRVSASVWKEWHVVRIQEFEQCSCSVWPTVYFPRQSVFSCSSFLTSRLSDRAAFWKKCGLYFVAIVFRNLLQMYCFMVNETLPNVTVRTPGSPAVVLSVLGCIQHHNLYAPLVCALDSPTDLWLTS